MAPVILAIDPGSEQSAWLTLAAGSVDDFGIEPNEVLLQALRGSRRLHHVTLVVIEKIESFGMAVGAEVFETVWWSGRMAEASRPIRVERVGRRAVKLHLCGSVRAKDANIRQALIDRYGGPSSRGTKAHPGPLFGIANDVWSALAVAVTAADTLP